VQLLRKEQQEHQEIPDYLLTKEYRDTWTRNFWTKQTFVDFFLYRAGSDDMTKGIDLEVSSSNSQPDSAEVAEEFPGDGVEEEMEQIRIESEC